MPDRSNGTAFHAGLFGPAQARFVGTGAEPNASLEGMRLRRQPLRFRCDPLRQNLARDELIKPGRAHRGR